MYIWDSINWHSCDLQWPKSTPKSYRCCHLHRDSIYILPNLSWVYST